MKYKNSMSDYANSIKKVIAPVMLLLLCSFAFAGDYWISSGNYWLTNESTGLTGSVFNYYNNTNITNNYYSVNETDTLQSVTDRDSHTSNSLYVGVGGYRFNADNGTGMMSPTIGAIGFQIDGEEYYRMNAEGFYPIIANTNIGIVTNPFENIYGNNFIGDSCDLNKVIVDNINISVNATLTSIRPFSDTTAAIRFFKADGITNFMTLNTLSKQLELGNTKIFADSYYMINTNYGFRYTGTPTGSIKFFSLYTGGVIDFETTPTGYSNFTNTRALSVNTTDLYIAKNIIVNNSYGINSSFTCDSYPNVTIQSGIITGWAC